MAVSGIEESSSARNSFVGRERELAELISACQSPADSDAHLFLIYGEPGIGKTRLADELAARIKAGGQQVLWGRCWEGEGAPAYWPWIQIIRTFLGALEPERRRNLALESEIASDIVHEVAQIIPDLRPVHSTPPPSVSDKLDPNAANAARFRLFDAVTNFLKSGARSHPMLIVVDDLQDADEASLALLRFMARELRGAPILIVATYRDLEVRRSPSLAKMIAELSREARSIPVGGLSESEVTEFVKFRAGQTPDQALVAKLCAATNGNPLFVDGIVRNLIAEGAFEAARAQDHPFKIPSGIREAIRDRLERLSPEANSILAVAAAIGNEFEFNLCQSVADVSAEKARRLLDEAAAAGAVTALDHGRYRFSHALVRGAVYEELDTNRRVLIHDTIAKSLEEMYQKDLDPHLAELAHHFREAGVPKKAIEYLGRAGNAAVNVFAWTDAAGHWEAALELVKRHGSNPQWRAELLRGLGGVAFETDHARAIQYLEPAIALYESIGGFEQAALIRINLGTVFEMPGQPLYNATLAKEHFRRAESVLAKGPETESLALLYHRIAEVDSQRMDLLQGALAARRAIEMSQRLGYKAPLVDAMGTYAKCLVLGGQLKEGFALFDQAWEVALAANHAGLAVAWAAGWFTQMLGDPRSARIWFELERNRPINAHSPFRLQLFSFLSDNTYFDEGQLDEVRRRIGAEHWGIRHLVGGEWEIVTALQEAAAEQSERLGDRNGRLNWNIGLGGAYHLLGDYPRGIAHLQHGLDNGDRGPVVLHEMRARPLLARLHVSMNQLDAAAKELDRCHQIVAAGEDWRGLAGDVARAEAVVAAARGDLDIADRQFEAALAIHQKYHLALEKPVTQWNWGQALAGFGDRVRSAEKFDAAVEIYRSLGVGPRFIEFVIADKARMLGPTPTHIDSGDAKQSHTESKLTGTFRREGEFWTINYDATTFRLKDAKGLRYIAYLLSHPGSRVHVYDLIEAVEGSASNDRMTIDAESEDLEIVREIDAPGPTIDGRARSEYRIRLRDLQAELDEADRMNDLGRSERLRTEIEMVGQELTGSSGLGRRARGMSPSAERARGMVGKNIRSVVDKIRREHLALGRHFSSAITTGYFCAYEPDPDHPISWQL